MITTIISIVLAIITLILTIICFFSKGIKKENLMIPYLIFAVFIVFTYFYKVGEYPYSLHIDEAGAVYDGISIARYGTDRYMNPFPMYFVNFGGGQNALFTYVFAGWYKLLSLFITIDFTTMDIDTLLLIIRMPTLIYNMIAYLICFLTIRKIYGNKVAVISAVVVLSMPISFMHSRFSLESYYLYPTLLIALSMFMRAIRSHSNIQYIISGLFFGLSLYTYAIFYAILPILLVGLLVIIIFTKNFNIKNCISFLLPLIVIAIPIALFLCVNYFDLPEFRFCGLTITKLPQFRSGEISLKNIYENVIQFKYFHRVFIRDGYDYNSLVQFSTMFYINIPFMIMGFITSIKKVIKSAQERHYVDDYLFLVLLIASFIIGIMTLSVNVNKAQAIYLPLSFYIVIGYMSLFNKNKVLFRIAIFILVFNYVLFIRFYFSYDIVNNVSESKDLLRSIQQTNLIDKNDDNTIVIYKNKMKDDIVYFGLFRDIDLNKYNDKNYMNRKYVRNISNNDNELYIVENILLDELKESVDSNLKRIEYKDYSVYYYK